MSYQARERWTEGKTSVGKSSSIPFHSNRKMFWKSPTAGIRGQQLWGWRQGRTSAQRTQSTEGDTVKEVSVKIHGVYSIKWVLNHGLRLIGMYGYSSLAVTVTPRVDRHCKGRPRRRYGSGGNHWDMTTLYFFSSIFLCPNCSFKKKLSIDL